MMTTPGTTVSRVLDHLERMLWEAQDRRLTAAGWEVTRIGRWRRSYRRLSRYAGDHLATGHLTPGRRDSHGLAAQPARSIR